MKSLRTVLLLLPLLLFMALPAADVRAALLDVGPVVPEVIGSSEPTLGHGFPLWYRDTNRVPLELCTDRVSGMCLTAEPSPGLPLSFPDNLGDELFWWVGDAEITTIPGATRALLVQAIEAAFSTGDVVSGAQVSFARIRIRFAPLPAAGEYTVTTPFKTFVFNVTADLLEINHTEDIGIAEGGVFTGALNGSVGPFLYCKDAALRPAGYIGDPNVPCEVEGSTFPSAQNPSNFFRIQGPGGFDHQTTLFSISGKLHSGSIPTPLTVDRVAYTRQASGTQVNAFVTSQALSNQTAPAPFPANFALIDAPSVIEVTATDLPTVATATNSPADGKFFGNSGQFANPASLPATATVTNTSDTPPTVRVVPLVDDVVIASAMFNAATGQLIVSAASYDSVAAPALAAYMPGMAAPLGSLVNGQLSVTFPITDSTVNPPKTYNIPPERVTVVSALGGSDTKAVTGLSPFTAVPTGTIVINGGAAFTSSASVTLSLSATSANGPVTQMQFSKDGVNFFSFEPYATTRVVTLLPGDGPKTMYVRFADAAGKVSAIISAPITLDTVLPSGTLSINGGALFTSSSIVNLTLSATDANGVSSMQFSNDGINFFTPVPYATSYSVNLLPGDGVRTLLARFIDAAGNVSAAVSASITVSSVPATGGVVINGGADFTRSAVVNLLISATATNATVTEMQVSKDGVNYFAFEPYATTRNLTLLPGDGVKNIYVRFKDSLGNISAPVSDSIILDTTKPTGTIAFTTPDPTTTATGTLALTADDANGVTQMQFSKNGGASYFAFEPFATSRTVTLAVGPNTLTVRFKDSAGNVSDPVSASITRN